MKSKPPARHEMDIVQILAKIKGKIVRERIRVKDFMQDFDKCNNQVINCCDFKRALYMSGLNLTENEIITLADVLV